MAHDIIEAVISFWFDEGIVPGLCEYRPIWFASPPEFDAAIAARFGEAYEQAARNELDYITASPKGTLALILMLDQFPRSLFRSGPRAFATDAKARAICCDAIRRGDDQQLSRIQRIFCYLPLQHSEALEDQLRSVRLFESLGEEKVFHFIQEAARRHLDIIERFGRFPHRNADLSRVSTADERAFLGSDEGQFWSH